MFNEILHSACAQVVLPSLVALLLVVWIYFKVLKVAKGEHLMDNPDGRKLQKSPVPVMGGAAVFFGVVGAVLLGCTLMDCASLLPVMVAMVVMLYTGIMDDIISLSPLTRIAAEVLVLTGIIFASGQCVDNLHGLFGVGAFPWWIAVPLTIFAGVGIINAMNMIDGVNGLSSGLCITCAGLFGGVFLKRGDMPNAMLAFAMTASLIPFLLHNVFGKRSRMFIGDAGTMMMGVLLSWFIICLLSGSNDARDARLDLTSLALAILSVPVFDTLRVMTQRLLRGISPFRADKTHLHHAFIEVGISHSITALSEILIDALIVLIWYTAYRLGASHEVQFAVVLTAAILLVWGTYALLRLGSGDNAWAHALSRFAPRTHLGHTKGWLKLQARLDAPEYTIPKDRRFGKPKYTNDNNKTK